MEGSRVVASTISVILYSFLEKYGIVYTLNLGTVYTYKEQVPYKVFLFYVYNMIQVKILLNTELS